MCGGKAALVSGRWSDPEREIRHVRALNCRVVHLDYEAKPKPGKIPGRPKEPAQILQWLVPIWRITHRSVRRQGPTDGGLSASAAFLVSPAASAAPLWDG